MSAIDNSTVPEHLRIILSRRNLGDSQFANVNSDGVFHFDAVPIGEDLSLSLGDRNVGMVGGTYTASGEYLLRASLDQGIRNFDIKVHAVDAEPR